MAFHALTYIICAVFVGFAIKNTAEVKKREMLDKKSWINRCFANSFLSRALAKFCRHQECTRGFILVCGYSRTHQRWLIHGAGSILYSQFDLGIFAVAFVCHLSWTRRWRFTFSTISAFDWEAPSDLLPSDSFLDSDSRFSYFVVGFRLSQFGTVQLSIRRLRLLYFRTLKFIIPRVSWIKLLLRTIQP